VSREWGQRERGASEERSVAGRRVGGRLLRVPIPRVKVPIARGPAARALLGGALIALVAACGTGPTAGAANPASQASTNQASTANEPPGTLTETGSSLLWPLADAWARAYHRDDPAVTVTTKSTSSGKGIDNASAGKVDIGASDAFLSSGDLVKNDTLLNIPLAVSAQTVIYNVPAVSQGTNIVLNGTLLAGMYNGTITYWDNQRIKNVNPGVSLPHLKVVPIHRKDTSGDTFLFTSYLAVQDQDWDNAIGYGTRTKWPPVKGELKEAGSQAIMRVCAQNPGCVAYNGISHLSQALTDHLGYAQLDNAFGAPELPTANAINHAVASFVAITPPNETISMINGPATSGYPIVNYEYAIVSTRQPSAAKASALRAFLTWVITTGNMPAFLDPVGFQPLQPDIVKLAKTQIAEIQG
jgi:phosphate transport system substrate-binding protein